MLTLSVQEPWASFALWHPAGIINVKKNTDFRGWCLLHTRSKFGDYIL